VIADARSHRRCSAAEALMDTAKVLVEEVQADGCGQVLDLLAESICQSCKPGHRHSHRQVLPLDVAGRNVLRVGIAADLANVNPCADGWRIPPLSFGSGPYNFINCA
jgi:hypothetical protein